MNTYRLLFIAFIAASSIASAAQFRTMLSNPGTLAEHWTILSGEWTEADGVITGKTTNNEEAWLMTKVERHEFDIVVQFRTPNPCNGGVQFRSHWLPKLPVAEGATPVNQFYGYQANIDTRTEGVTGTVFEKNGRKDLAKASTEATATVKSTDWNTMLIIGRGPVIEVYLNGVCANTLYDEAFIGGYFALQVEPIDDTTPGVIEYREISLPHTPYPRVGDWQPLFNGKDLDNWSIWGTEQFTVEDGVIVCKSGPDKGEGYLLTKDSWKDFRVRGTFKMLGEGNYGLFYRSTISYDEKKSPIISGIQGEVMPGRPAHTGRHYESYRRGWLTPPNTDELGSWALREGEWNEIEIRAIGNHITSWVNGIRVTDFFDNNPQVFDGGFALQLHAGGTEGILWKDLLAFDPLK